MASIELRRRSALFQTWNAPVVRSVRRFVRRRPLPAVAGFSLFLIAVIVAVGPFAITTNPYIGNLTERLQSPNMAHLLGTDQQGRDMLTRLIYGGRTSVIVGLGAAFVGAVAGTAFGMVSAYMGGITDILLQRITDAMMAIPGIILLMVLTLALPPSTFNTLLAIGILFTPAASRVVRGVVLAIKQEPYIEAARSLGASTPRVILRHVLPNTMAPVIVLASLLVGGGIITEAALGFLGLSVGPPNPTWGNLLNAGSQNYMEQAPWLAISPGVAIAITVIAANLFGDGLRDVLDPRLRGST